MSFYVEMIGSFTYLNILLLFYQLQVDGIVKVLDSAPNAVYLHKVSCLSVCYNISMLFCTSTVSRWTFSKRSQSWWPISPETSGVVCYI